MFDLADVGKRLLDLASDRPVFHSESDFQHALAWNIHISNPGTVVRLERPFRSENSSEYLDLFFANPDRSVAVELKYKTRRHHHNHQGEKFFLRNQSAQDLGRYDFLADVQRLERFVKEGRANIGCAILLTNDQSYWNTPHQNDTVDQQFRLHEERVVEGCLAWRSNAAAGTIRSRESAINLRGKYTAVWKPYTKLSELPGDEFRFLAWLVK